MMTTLSGLSDLSSYATSFLIGLTPDPDKATVVGLSGDLGSGKTAFTKALGKDLGIQEEILSPTFVIAKYYPLSGRPWKQLVHIDAYRIEDPKEIDVLHFNELLADSRNLVIIEWPEQLQERFPADAKTLRFRFVDEMTREVG